MKSEDLHKPYKEYIKHNYPEYFSNEKNRVLKNEKELEIAKTFMTGFNAQQDLCCKLEDKIEDLEKINAISKIIIKEKEDKIETRKNVVNKLQKKADSNFKSFIMPEIKKINPKKNDFFIIKYKEDSPSFETQDTINNFCEQLSEVLFDEFKDLKIQIVVLPKNITTEFKSREDVKELLSGI